MNLGRPIGLQLLGEVLGTQVDLLDTDPVDTESVSTGPAAKDLTKTSHVAVVTTPVGVTGEAV